MEQFSKTIKYPTPWQEEMIAKKEKTGTSVNEQIRQAIEEKLKRDRNEL